MHKMQNIATEIKNQSKFSLAGTDIYNGLRGKSFNECWKFHKGEITNGQSANLDDSNWQSVTLPHDWAIYDGFSPDALSGGDGAYLDGGIGWYRKTFDIPKEYEGKNISVGFDGISELGKVWINGTYIGFRPNGYASFECDLTPYLNYDGKNVIAVRAHKNDKAARWYNGAGIYRNVWLNVLNPVHIDYCGMNVRTRNIQIGKSLI